MTGMVVFVGQAPSLALAKAGNGSPFASGRSTDRLARLCGLSSTAQLHERAWLLNVGRNDFDGDEEPASSTRLRALEIVGRLKGRRVVLLGVKVAAAFGLHHLPLLEWRDVVAHGSRFKAARCPHPSGLNRYWNDPANCDLARVFLSEAVWS